METSYVKVFSESPIFINRVRTLLEEQNIPSFVKNQIESARLAGFGVLTNTVDLYIYKSDLKKATHIVQDFIKDISS